MTAVLPMDIHSHSEYSHDGSYLVSKMCGEAAGQGIAVFAVTDHYDINGSITDFSATDDATRRSVQDTIAARKLYGDKIEILAGLELGQPLENLAKAEEILTSHPFDYILGSIHNNPGSQDFYYYSPTNEAFPLETETERYFLGLLDMIRWGRFDSLAHLTLPFRYILRFQEYYYFGKWDDYVEAIVRALAEKGLAMEINTSGMRWDPPYTMPEARWVRRFMELGGERLTLGADAHSPQQIGAGIAEGARIADEAGFAYLCYFAERKPRYLKLDDYR